MNRVPAIVGCLLACSAAGCFPSAKPGTTAADINEASGQIGATLIVGLIEYAATRDDVSAKPKRWCNDCGPYRP